MVQTQCRYFNGYKPCGKNNICSEECHSKEIPQTSVLIVHLGAIGAVVRSTSLLAAIKRKYPQSLITWVTDSPSHQLLSGHPLLDRVLTTSEADLLSLSCLCFDVALVVDKSLKSFGVLQRTKVKEIYGFSVDSFNGAIIPATAAAQELWQLGIDNELKFFINQKPETQLIHEALELGPYQRDEYFLPLREEEFLEAQKRKENWRHNKKVLIGINTGCSATLPAKKLSISNQKILISKLQKNDFINNSSKIVLLGGPEDTERNSLIGAGMDVIQSPTEKGLRDGLVSVAACDIVITGDSLGMHMAISQKKWVIAWFGPTCSQEIDLYERGEKMLSQVTCGPCWKRSCQKPIMCYDQVNIDSIVMAVQRFLENTSCQPTLSFKQPFLEISS